MLKVNGGRRVVVKLEGCVVCQILAQVIQEEVADGMLADDLCAL
jgi:hypothetical protein